MGLFCCYFILKVKSWVTILHNIFELVDVNCPICASTQSNVLFSVKDYQHQVSQQVFFLKKCKNCGVGFVSPRPKEDDISAFYSDEFYWSHEGLDAVQTADAILESRKSQLAEKAKVIANILPGKLLDIGTQKGDFIYFMQKKGWQCEGVEFSDKPKNLFNMPIKYGEFSEIEFVTESYDCITIWAVLEHVYSPKNYVDKIGQLVKPGGYFVGLVTNLNSIQGRFFQTDDYPRHLTIFTKKSLSLLLVNAGFKVLRIWTDQRIFGSPLRGFFTYTMKRSLGYTRDEVMLEWHNINDHLAFSCKFKGRPSLWVKWCSRIDNIVLGPIEKVLDKMGFGHLLLWEAVKIGGNDE